MLHERSHTSNLTLLKRHCGGPGRGGGRPKSLEKDWTAPERSHTSNLTLLKRYCEQAQLNRYKGPKR